MITGFVLVGFLVWRSIEPVRSARPALSSPSTGSPPSFSAAATPAVNATRLPSRVANDTLTSAADAAPSTNIMDSPIEGQRAVADISFGGRKYSLKPAQYGIFDQILVEPSSRIPVQVTYPDGEPGEKVIVEVEDGGRLDNDSILAIQSLDDEKRLAFVFRTTAQTGLFRVTLRKGADVKTLNFWAGPELPVAAAR